jgi:hypothetical protein
LAAAAKFYNGPLSDRPLCAISGRSSYQLASSDTPQPGQFVQTSAYRLAQRPFAQDPAELHRTVVRSDMRNLVWLLFEHDLLGTSVLAFPDQARATGYRDFFPRYALSMRKRNK